MIIPELPAFLTSLGGENYKGLIIALFTLSAGLSRPISGKLADTIGRIPVMVFGTLVCVICSLLYPFLTSVAGFLLLRFFHGFSTGFKPTASTAFAADIIPPHRRGEAMGILGISMNIGASAFPPIGSSLVIHYSMDIMFYVSSLLALISIVMLMGLRETLENKQAFRPSLLKMPLNEIIEVKAFAPAFVTLFIYFTFGVLLTISPDQSVYLGLENKGLIFTSITFCSILSRAVAGKVSDIYGRIIVIKMSVLLMVLAHFYMAIADSPFDLLLAGGALGFATGIASPAIFAWVIDISPEDRKARYMATVYIALEIGIGTGALFSAWSFANNPDFFARTYYATAALTLVAGVYLQFFYKKEILNT